MYRTYTGTPAETCLILHPCQQSSTYTHTHWCTSVHCLHTVIKCLGTRELPIVSPLIKTFPVSSPVQPSHLLHYFRYRFYNLCTVMPEEYFNTIRRFQFNSCPNYTGNEYFTLQKNFGCNYDSFKTLITIFSNKNSISHLRNFVKNTYTRSFKVCLWLFFLYFFLQTVAFYQISVFFN